MSDAFRLGLTGDVMLGRQVDGRQRRRAVDAVWGDLLERLRALDGLFVNLECCLSTRGRPWTGRPFHFRADPEWAVPALRRAGVVHCSLANNHVLDFHEPALRDTLDALDAAGIAHSGAGRDVAAAREPAVVQLERGRNDDGGTDRGDGADVGDAADPDDATDADGDRLEVAVVSFTDNTPEYAADEDEPGTAHVVFDDDPDHRRIVRESIAAARERDPDLLIASLHWGPNMVTEPPAEFRAFGRWLAEEGVDVVHGHSAHVVQGIEVHDGTPILYDAGDFVDDYAVDADLRNDRSFLFEARVVGGAIAELRLHPVEIRDCAVHAADADAAAWCRERVRDLSAPFGTEFRRDGEALVLPLGG